MNKRMHMSMHDRKYTQRQKYRLEPMKEIKNLKPNQNLEVAGVVC